MGKVSVTMDVGADGVAVIEISNPPVNALANQVLQGLKQKHNEAVNRSDVTAIVIIGALHKFSGGFDINTLLETQKTGNVSLLGHVNEDIMINMIEAAKKPSVAAIEGLALGGGLELAMSCHARIATPKAQLGLPELQLGIIPGFGGTQRLPRLVGLKKAIEMMLLSKAVSSEEGKELGLVDAVAPPDQLLSTARQWALDIAAFRRPWQVTLQRNDKLEPLTEAREIIKRARDQAKKRSPNVPHPIACLDVIEEGIISGGYAGGLKEDECFRQLVLSDTGKSLVHIFFAQRATSKVSGFTDRGLKPRPIRSVAVIGGGLMGSGIAVSLITNNIPVILKEVNAEFLQQALERIKKILDSRVKRGSLTQDKAYKMMSMVNGVLDYAEFRNVDMVIEAASENIDLKQQIFVDLEKFCPLHCVLATNTSTIKLDLVGQRTRSEDRVVGAHYFSPAHVMPLIEIIHTEKTSPQVVVDVLNIAKITKKIPVVVGSCTGFAVNRLIFPYTHSAYMLVDLGIDVYRVDRVVTAFGLPMGTFRLADMIGYQVARAVEHEFCEAYPERTYRSKILPLMMQDGRLGERNNKGFYAYDANRKAYADLELKKYQEKSQQIAGIMPNGKPIVVSDEEIVQLLFFPVVNEACRLLDEGIAAQASDLDVSSVYGFGFPAYRGGVVFWANLIGAATVASKLRSFSQDFGPFFKPCTYLEEHAQNGIPLGTSKKDLKSRL